MQINEKKIVFFFKQEKTKHKKHTLIKIGKLAWMMDNSMWTD